MSLLRLSVKTLLKNKRQFVPVLLVLTLVLTLASGTGGSTFARDTGRTITQQQHTDTTSSSQAITAASTQIQLGKYDSTPFMHRPYYGDRTISQRTVSFVDHDKPWYVNDGIFVRYDGQKWTNISFGSCRAGVNCYDGHNGYDLDMWYEPVLSVAAGTVIRAGWYNPLNHQSALGLWAAVDHGNGYVTAYGHLSALTVAVGDQIGTQWQIGTSGTSGSSTGPHLHMATYYLPNWYATDPFGWTGNYADPNIVPDNYLWVNNPGTGYTIPYLSGNGNATVSGATVVDDGSAGWSSTGNWSTANGSTDIGGSLHWTTTSNGSATATATWQPKLPSDGYYEVGVFVDDNHATSSWVPYTIYSADPNHPGTEVKHLVYVDETHIGSFAGPFGHENTGPQWIGLGTYYFQAALNGRVVLSNATGEQGAQLAANGMEFAPAAVQGAPQPPSYGFSLSSDGTPAAMQPGSTSNINITLLNSSNFTWPATGSNAVQVIYRWRDAQNQLVATGNTVALPADVQPAASVSVSVPVLAPSSMGNYTLEWDLVQNGKAFSQLGAQAHQDAVSVIRYAENFSSASLPTSFPPGATVNLNVTVQNTGAITWPANGGNQVTLGYHWLDSQGHALDPSVTGQSSMGLLNGDVAPGGTTTIPVTLNTPVLAGNYQLVFDLQQQGTWFSSQGATPLTLSVSITSALPETYYFAEGYTGTGTTETLALTNPSPTVANVTITFLYQGAGEQTHSYQVPAQAQSILNINQEAGPNQAVSMIVQSDQPIIAQRSMLTQKGNFVAGTSSVGSSTLNNTWYFAEGNTTYGWNTLLAVMNPATQPVTVKITYLLNAGLARAKGTATSATYVFPARSRGTIVLNQDFPDQQFGMIITASSPVLVERPEYLVISPLRGGSSMVGATAPQSTWYFGSGYTSPGFNERLVLTNPATTDAQVQVRYLTTTGSVTSQNITVPAQSRIEVNVNAALGQMQHATVITSSVPILAERQDFFIAQLNGSVPGSTTTMGVSHTSTAWYLAQADSNPGDAESLAIANPAVVSTQIQVVYYLKTGAPVIKTYTLAANTRMTINLQSEVGPNQSFGIALYASQSVVVEETVLFNVQGSSGGYALPGYGI